MLVNYRARYARGLPISSAGAEWVVDYVIGQRLKRNGHMRWSRDGANALLQVRCAVSMARTCATSSAGTTEARLATVELAA